MQSQTSKNSYREVLNQKKQRDVYLNKVIDICHSWLYTKKESEEARDYITNRIPFVHHKLFKFGYFPNHSSTLEEFLEELYKNIPNENPKQILNDLGIVRFMKNKFYSFFSHNPLLIPYYDIYGNPVSIAGRTLFSDTYMKENRISKYKNLPFKRNAHLFGFHLSNKNIIKKNFAIIVEGQVDFITSFINGLDNTVAVCGSSFSFEHLCLLMRYTNRFYVLMDNDEAGEKGYKMIESKAKKYGCSVNRLTLLSDCKDIDDFFNSGGKVSDIEKQL